MSSIAVLAPVEKERDQEQFDPVSQRSRKRNPSEQADEMAGHTSGEIHDGPIEASIAAPAWRQQGAPLAKSGQGVLNGQPSATRACHHDLLLDAHGLCQVNSPRGTIPGCTFDDPATFGIVCRLKSSATPSGCITDTA